MSINVNIQFLQNNIFLLFNEPVIEADVPECVSEWTVSSRTPGCTPPSDTSPACARNP